MTDARSMPPRRPPADPRLSGRILLVDDEPILLEAAKRALRGERLEVVTAASGREALGLLERVAVDVVVSDENMPGMSGTEFLRTVRERHPEVVRIMLTGQATLDLAIRLINEGEVYRLLQKPCGPVELVSTIRNAIQYRELSFESTRLLALARRRRATLLRLERHSPGITTVARQADGSIDLSDEEGLAPERLIAEIRGELADEGGSRDRGGATDDAAA
jgi:two-component system, probable response regulator PhcQ